MEFGDSFWDWQVEYSKSGLSLVTRTYGPVAEFAPGFKNTFFSFRLIQFLDHLETFLRTVDRRRVIGEKDIGIFEFGLGSDCGRKEVLR